MITNIRAFQEVLKRNNLPTPDTYLGISELIRSLYRPDVSPNPERIREVLEELTWPVTVPAGNPITFKSCSEVLASEGIVTFSPKQSGTGDPSPTNIRPIIGWDGLVLNRTGLNLCNWKWNTYKSANKLSIMLAQGDYVISSEIEMETGYIYVKGTKKDGTLCTKAELGLPSGWAESSTVGLYYGGNNTTRRLDFSIPENNVTFECGRAGQNGTINAMLNIGTNRLEYVPYQGETHTATFPETIMGGSYDFVSGKGKSEWGYIAEYDGETITEPWISSIDVYTPGTTPSTGAEVVYKLATPTEITLTPEDIELLRGVNTIWTDGDNVTVKFQVLK